MNDLEEIRSGKYISLETYKKDGSPVRTPVWFVIRDGLVCAVTRDQTGKAKRLRNNCQVKLAPCTITGKVTGGWLLGTVEILGGSDATDVIKLRDARYGFIAAIAKFFSKGRGNLLALAVRVD